MLIAFYILSALALLGALGLVLLRSPIYCALSLVNTLISTAGIFILLGHEFIAAAQVLIYAGAIMVLFLFVIMLLNLREGGQPLRWNLFSFVGALLCAGLFAQLAGVSWYATRTIVPIGAYPPGRFAQEGEVALVGDALLSESLLPFEMMGVLLTIAVMGAVVVAKRRTERPPS